MHGDIIKYPCYPLVYEIFEALGKFTGDYMSMRKKYPQLPELPDFSQTVPEVRNIPYHIAAFLGMNEVSKQLLLEEKDVIEKFRLLTQDLDRFNLDAKIEFDIQKKVSESIDKNQREYVLREKMKAVKDQLKEFDGGDKFDSYEEAITKHPELYPESVIKRIRQEITRVKALPMGSQEIGVATNYLELMVNLPWKVSSVDNEDLSSVKKILDENCYDSKHKFVCNLVQDDSGAWTVCTIKSTTIRRKRF